MIDHPNAGRISLIFGSRFVCTDPFKRPAEIGRLLFLTHVRTRGTSRLPSISTRQSLRLAVVFHALAIFLRLTLCVHEYRPAFNVLGTVIAIRRRRLRPRVSPFRNRIDGLARCCFPARSIGLVTRDSFIAQESAVRSAVLHSVETTFEFHYSCTYVFFPLSTYYTASTRL